MTDRNSDRLQPANLADPSNYLEGLSPNVLVDRVTGLTSPGEDRAQESESESESEQDPLLGFEGSRMRSTSERSKSRRRKVVWYKRPSPYWFFPGTLVLSIALAIVIPAKIEIYTQLVCRSMPASQSNTTLPPPLYDSSNPGDMLPSPITVPKPSSLLVFNNSGLGKYDKVVYDAAMDDDMKAEVEGDSWAKQCRRSKEVQKGVSKLATLLSFVMGLLSVLTTGFWGSLSDRYGRIPIIAIALAGTIFLDAIFLITVRYHDVVGYNFLIIGPLIDGALGGQATATAATNSYLSDASDAGSRAWVFSIMGAILFAGIAVGPLLGSILIEWTGSVMFVFYLALGMHVTYFTAIFFFPESLSKERQILARERHALDLKNDKEAEVIETESWKSKGALTILALRFKRAVFKLFSFLKPLSLLLPKDRALEDPLNIPILESKEQRKGINYELTKVAASYALFATVVAIMSVKILYAGFKYGYGPEENGYYLTFIGGVRVVFLLGILPVLIKLFKQTPPLPSSAYSLSRPEEYEAEVKYLKVVSGAKFDLGLAKISVFIEVIGYFLLATNYTGSQFIFLLSSGISCFGSGGSPALQSLSLLLVGGRETGKVFAGLGVISCVFAQILGPVLFGVIYYKSLGIYDSSIFVAGELLFIASLIILSFVKLGGTADLESDSVTDGGRGRTLVRKGSTSPVLA